MPVRVDPSSPVHPLTIVDVHEMVRSGIIDPGSHVELLDGVLAEMSPQGRAHAYAIRPAHRYGRTRGGRCGA